VPKGVPNSSTPKNTVIKANGGSDSLGKTTSLNKTHSLTMGRNKFNNFVETIKNQGIKEPIKYVEYKG